VKNILQEGSGVFGLHYSGTGKVREKRGQATFLYVIPAKAGIQKYKKGLCCVDLY
jgi:hypothetical protein